MIQKQFFRVFQLFAPEVKSFHQKHTWKNSEGFEHKKTRLFIFMSWVYFESVV